MDRVPDIMDDIPKSSKQKWEWSIIHPNGHSDPLFKVNCWTNKEQHIPTTSDNQPTWSYTMDEYEQIARDDHDTWSKIETDYFMELAKECQFNFIVMADRYRFEIPGTDIRNRTVPELRARYNQLCKNLPKYQHLYDPDYSKEIDEARREWLDKMPIKYPQDQTFGYIEQFVKNDYANLLYQRDQMMNIFSGDILAFIDGISQATTCLNTTKPAPIETLRSKKAQPPPLVTSPASRKTAGPILRSSKIKSIRSGLVKQVEKISLEIGLPSKPCIPTAFICEQYDEIRSLIVKLIDERKTTEKLEHELRVIKTTKKNETRPYPTKDDI